MVIHSMISPEKDFKDNTMLGTKIANMKESNHLLENKKGRFVKIALIPIPKKKIVMIPAVIGKENRIYYVEVIAFHVLMSPRD